MRKVLVSLVKSISFFYILLTSSVGVVDMDHDRVDMAFQDTLDVHMVVDTRDMVGIPLLNNRDTLVDVLRRQNEQKGQSQVVKAFRLGCFQLH